MKVSIVMVRVTTLMVLKGFGDILKGRLSAKGGIRKERLPLYLAEYVWKYNHRNDSIDLQKKLILQQLGR
jgi:hypothetical protein